MPKRLKVAVLIRHYDRSGGGAERYCVELTERLAEIHNVDVFAQKISTKSEKVNFHLVPLKVKRPRFINQLLFSWATRKATQYRYDIVHSHDMVTHADIYTLHVPCIKSHWTEASYFSRLPIALGILLSPRKISYMWLEWKELRPVKGRHFITVSKYLTHNILNSFPKLKGHITVAHPGINPTNIDAKQVDQLRTTFRQQHQIPKNDFVLLFVAHGFRRKGLPALIHALEILDQEDLYLVVAGRGNLSHISFNNKKVQDRTIFIGPISDMERIYPVADIFVHPSLGDTFGMAVLEAMQFGLPVIVSSSKYCGISDHLHDTSFFIIHEPTNSQEIAVKIEQLISSHLIREEMSATSTQISKSITWNNTLSQTLIAYSLNHTAVEPQ